MAKQEINLGSAPNAGDGDPLRTAFNKINENFTELYNSTGGLDLSSITESIIPSVDNTYNLGSPSKRWQHGYFATGSLYVGDIKLSNNAGQLVVQQVTNVGLVNEAPVPDTPGVVTTDRIINGANTFSITAAGALELNGDPFTGAGSADSLTSNDDINITINNDDSSSYTWNFGQTGDLTLPAGGDILDSEGNSVLGGGAVDNNIWIQTFETATPATDVPQVATSVEYDSDGNIIALFSHVNPETDSTYYSVGKYTTTGTRIWTTRFAGDFFTDGWGLAVDNSGGFVYIAGRISADGGQDNATLTKISGTTGLVEWSKKYDFGYNSSSAVVDVNAEGDPVMVGFAEGEVDRYVTTTKIDQTDGSIIWSRALDGQGDEEAYGMAVGPSSEVVAVGYMTQLGDSSDTEDHMVVVKYNSAGVIQWQRAILFDEGYDCTGSDADIDSQGNIYICGQYDTDIPGPISQLMSIVKFNSSGVKQWSRRIVGNCGAFTSSVVVGADDHLYLSASTFAGTEFTVEDIHLVLAKYSFDGLVEWQRLLDYTPGYSFGAFFFGTPIGGSNLAVKQDYVAVGLGFAGGDIFGPGGVNAAIAQIPASGNVFTVGNWDFKAASFSGTVNSTASDITVANADKTDYDNISGIDTATVTLEEDSSNFLIGTVFTAPSGDNSLINGAYTVTLENDGTVTLPAGGTITEGYVTSNPTIQLTPASPDVASQKLVIKGGGSYNASDNGIGLNWYIIDPLVNDTVEIYVNSPDNADQTLYWWIYPEGASIATPESGTVSLGEGGAGNFSFTVDSDDYEFTVRVSPESNNYDPATGVETQLFNSSAPTLDADHHLHLTTGDLTETSIFLGTDDHNVRTTVNGGIEITTPNTSNNVWQFGTDGSLTVPGDIRSEGNINIDINLSDSTLRRWQFGEDGDLILPAGGDIKDSSGNSVLGGGTGNGFTVLADGTLQANTDSNITTLSSLLTSKPTWLTITPRSPDRDTLDTHYGFTSSGMWFTGNNEETRLYQPAYPIHTTDSFPADVKVVVEFDIDLVSGQEDWGVCVYPADGVPHWNWDPHPSRIAATIECDDEGSPVVAQPTILGFYDSNSGPNVFEVSRARFTYDPVAELTTLELFDNDVVVSRTELPGRLARDQDYRIGFDADWDEAGVGDKSYFYNLLIESGNTTDAKATELTVTGEIKLPSTVKGFINIQGPWANNDDSIQFQSVAAHDGYAYMIGEAEWSESNRIRIDKYSLTSGELVWTRVLGAGRNATFDISWTGGAYTLTNIDNNGIGYQVGQLVYISADSIVGGQSPDNLVTITITDVDDEGDIVTATIAGTAPSGTSSQAGLTESNSDGRGDPTSIKYDTVTDTLVVLTAHYTAIGDANDSNWDRALITRINPVSGDVISTVTLSDEGDIRPYDVAVHPTTGATAVVGEKYNEYRAFGTLTMAVKADGYFDILKSNLDAEHYPGSGIPGEYFGDYWISGTGVTNREWIDNVNYYENVSSTTRQGSGATFTIVDNGDGTYGVSAPTLAGTNYRVGHKIKVLGTEIGGATPANDCVVTVNEINPTTGAITILGNVSGTAAGVAYQAYNDRSGTNYNVGSGFTLDITVDAVTGSRIANVNLGGDNYVANDVAVIPGTVFAGGATPANDVEVTIVSIGEAGGNVTSAVTAGTTPTNIIRIQVLGVDFTAVGGSWTLTQDLDGEAFVWTAGWNKAIGGPSNDQFQSVVYSKDGASIYAVGSGSYEVTHRQSLVVKYATSDGTIEFSKYLNSDTVDSYATGVATIGTSDIVVAGYERNTIIGIDRDQQFVARLTSSGTVVWKKFYGDGNWGNSIDNNCDIQVDSDDNIYVTMAEGADNPSFTNRGFTVTKLDQYGNLVWSRCVSGQASSYLQNWNGNRFSSLANDQLVVAGYTQMTDQDYDSGLWVSFPTDGFTYLGGESEFVQQGAFRFSPGRIKNGVITLDTGGSFTPSVQAPTITASNNLKKYETREPLDFFEQHLHKITDPKHGGLVFGDGSRQTFATDKIPQIKADDDYTITAQDSGKHIYLKNNSGTITIPVQDGVNSDLPVGFTFTIINRTGSDCYVRLYDTEGPTRGTILGAGRDISTWDWGIPDSGSGSMVTLIKLESLQMTGMSVTQEPVWMISGPGDIYDNTLP